MTDSLPVVEPPFDRDTERESSSSVSLADKSPIIGVVLAAGTSSRFGDRNKLLLTWREEPLVRHAARTLCESVVDDVVVVTGHEHERVTTAVGDLDVTAVHNDAYEAGQATTVRRGVAAVRDRNGAAALIALGDMPLVSVESVDRLVAAYRAGAGDALAACCEGVRGNPVLFDDRHFDALSDVAGDIGGREILLTDDRSVLVETGDEGVLTDVDRHGDLEKLQERR
ncbi:nucleotidyltransferase family protein [Halorubrum amylolyticum]|uniref:nucleotidyltransferase family protein n=1 Tax=Halorubrum amylolyticum TaxID=2508724 RepID=UPI001F507647|nr:nucleotidyltransferase family protein [Halorubrum amylolyticum]